MSKPTRYVYEFGPFQLDMEERLLLRDGRPVSLKPKLFDLLLLFVQNGGHMLTKEELMSEIWPNSFVEEHNLAVSIFALRKALGETQHGPVFIETIPRYGYRFVADVKRLEDEHADPSASKEGRLEIIAGEEAETTSDLKSIVVLPLKFIGEEPGDEYLGIGMTDALITKLSNLRQITVRPTSAVRKYVGGGQEPVVVGRELKATAVLDGRIRRVNERVRVIVQLINVKDGTTLWAEKFDEKFTDIFALEDSISEQVARALTLELTKEERGRLAKRYTENTEAYQAYLKGRYFLNKKTPEGLKRSVEYFQQAIKIDPRYARAYAGLADSYIFLFQFSVHPSSVSYAKAKESVLKALQLDETLVEAHATLGHLRMFCDWDWRGAESEYKCAIEINHNDAIAHQLYSVYLRHNGRFDQAIAEINRAQELDPISLSINLSKGITFHFAREYDRAIQELYKVLELDENYPPVHFVMGLAYEQKEEYERAIAAYQKANSILDNNNPEVRASIGRSYALTGKTDEAMQSLDELLEQSQLDYISPYYIALIYIGLEEEQRAFAWLEKAYDLRDSELCLLKVDPRFDSLRGDPRFQSLLKRVGFINQDE